MAFQLTCHGCGAVLNVQEKHIGKTGKCIKCGERIEIVPPVVEPPHDTTASEATEQPKANGSAEQPKAKKVKRSIRPASDRQKAFATDLGIEFDEKIDAREMSKLIDAALEREEAIDRGEIETHLKTLRKCEPEDMVNEMRKRGFWAIMLLRRYDAPEGTLSGKFVGCDGLTEDDAKTLLVRSLFALIEEEGGEISHIFGFLQEYLRADNPGWRPGAAHEQK